MKTIKLEGAVKRLIVADVDGGEDDWVAASDEGVALYLQDRTRV